MYVMMFYKITHTASLSFNSTGSKDNISAIVVRLPGAIIPSGGISSASSVRVRVESKADDEDMGDMGAPPDTNI